MTTPASPPILQRLGGDYHLNLEDPRALVHLHALDETRWAALRAPTQSIHADPDFLRVVDLDGNGILRVADVRGATLWLLARLAGRSRLGQAVDDLALADLDQSNPEGKALHDTAEALLERLVAEDRTRLSLEQAREGMRRFVHEPINGDGVVSAVGAGDEAMAALIRDIVATLGGIPEVAGGEGVDEARLDAFLAEARAYLDWIAEARTEPNRARLMVLGEATPEAFDAFEAVAERIEQYYALCGWLRVDKHALAGGLPPLDAAALATGAATAEHLAALPLAAPTACEGLPLAGPYNPAHRDAFEAFRARVIHPLIGEQSGQLLASQWAFIQAAFSPYREWLARRPAVAVESLGAERLAAILASDTPDRLRQRLADDRARHIELRLMGDLERIILYQRWLPELARDFVSFDRLYDPEERSWLEAGSLIMDGRRFNFVLPVENRAAHKSIAQRSAICLIYVSLHEPAPLGDPTNSTEPDAPGEPLPREVVAAVTNGSMENLFPGKGGLFRARDGRCLDARIEEVVLNPVSLAEAMKAPFRRLIDFVGEQAERFSSQRYKDLETGLGSAVDATDKASSLRQPGTAAPAASNTAAPAIRDLLLGGGVALAALGGTVALIAQTLRQASLWHVVLALVGILVLLAVPTFLAALWKLRRRNLAPLLEACGVAVNPTMRLTESMGRCMSQMPHPPPGTRIDHHDLLDRYLKRVPAPVRPRARWASLILLALLLGILLAWSRPVWRGAIRRGYRALIGTPPAPESSPSPSTRGTP